MSPDKGFIALVTDRVVVRRFRLSDAARLTAYRSDPEVARFQSWSADYSESDAIEFIRQMGSRHPGTAGQWFQFAVATKDADRLIGDCGLCCSASPPCLAELGFSLAPGAQGLGYAREAIRAVNDYAFDALGVERILGVADRRNAAACRLMQALGWKEGARDNPEPPSGPLGDHEVMYLSRARMSEER